MVSIASWTLLLLAGFCAAEVYDGTPARIEDFPSLVQIESGIGNFLWAQTCVGSVLTSRHVLSAAHCFVLPSIAANLNIRIRRVRAGATFRGRDGVILNIATISNHPSFGVSGFDGDVSVLRLATSLTFGTNIQAIPITASGINFPANIPVTVAGWGRTTEDVIWANRELHSATLYTLNHDSCVAKYASLPVPITISENMICTAGAGAEGQNFGLRDSGAAVYFDGVLVGLVAMGLPAGDSYPLVATAISSYSNWIVETAV